MPPGGAVGRSRSANKPLAKRKVGSVGLISDTHGLRRQEALDALKGSDLIIHAGDIGVPEIVDPVMRPCAGGRGAREHRQKALGPAGCPWPQSQRQARILIYVLHDLAQLDLDPAVDTLQSLTVLLFWDARLRSEFGERRTWPVNRRFLRVSHSVYRPFEPTLRLTIFQHLAKSERASRRGP